MTRRMHPLFTARLLGQPHLIAPAAGRAVLDVLMPGARLDGAPACFDDGPLPLPDARSFMMVGGVAVVPVIGELVHRGGSMDAASGVTSYQALADMISAALENPAVEALCLDIDSYGGEGPGCLDFALWLGSKRGRKPICASINQAACSAAYAIASGADQICIGEDGTAGSIGVVAYHADLSAAMASDGIAVEFVFAGARKIDGNQTQPLSDPARAALQARVDAMYARFCAVVAANRGMSAEAVAATEAACFRGRDAIAAGLADACTTMEDCVMQLNSRAAAPGSRMRASAATLSAGPTGRDLPPAPQATPSDGAGPPQTDPELPPPAAEPEQPPPGLPPPGLPPVVEPPPPDAQRAAPEALADACAAAGLPELIAPLLRERASMPAVQQRITDAGTIIQAARQSGQPGMGRPLILAGISPEAAREILFAARAEGADASRINTARPGDNQARSAPDVSSIYQTYNNRTRRG
jgi:ClpP class serine protease